MSRAVLLFTLCAALATGARAQGPTNTASQTPAYCPAAQSASPIQPAAPAGTPRSILSPPPGGVNLKPWYLENSFQRCCQVASMQGIVGSNGPGLWTITVNNEGWAFNIQPLPTYKFPQSPGISAGSPVWANFWTRQASFDGVTECCTITSGAPVCYSETVYLDILPTGVIYAPPGDPNATGAAAPFQTFTYTNSNQTSTTIITSGVAGGTTTFQATFGGSGDTVSSGSTTQQQSQLSEQNSHSYAVGQKASPPAGYSGSASVYDIIWFYVNPTFDVIYVGAYNYGDKSPPLIPAAPAVASVSVHTAKQGDPGFDPPVQWNHCAVTVLELQTAGANAPCLNTLLAAPQPAVPVNPITKTVGAEAQPLTPAQRLLQLDPMAPSTPSNGLLSVALPVGLNGFQPTGPPPFLVNNPRFSLIGGPYNWNFCTNPGPWTNTVTNSQVKGTQTTTVNKSTSSTTFTLNPIQLVAAIVSIAAAERKPGAADASGGGVPGGASESVSFGNSWEVDTSTLIATQQTNTLNTAISYGGGTTPADPPVWVPSTFFPNSAPSTNFPNGNFVTPTTGNTYVYINKTASGTSGATEPAWCTTSGCTVKDGTITWTLYSHTCDTLPSFETTLYYDQLSDTVLFWTVADPPSYLMVKGRAASSKPGQYSVVFTQDGGSSGVTTLTDSKGQFSLSLPPGNYTYQVMDSTGHSLTGAPVHVTVPANQSLPLQLPAIDIG